MNGVIVGAWSLPPNTPDTLQYDLAWTQSEQGWLWSLSLSFIPGKVPLRGERVHADFENLPSDSQDIRE